MNFQVGDIAIVRDTVWTPYWGKYVGTECTILAVGPTEGFGQRVAYLVSLVDGAEVGAMEYHLRKRDEDGEEHYNGHEKCEWSDCIWQPSEPVTVPIEVEHEKANTEA